MRRGIQTRIREELRPASERRQDMLDAWVKEFEAGQEGALVALKGADLWVLLSQLEVLARKACRSQVLQHSIGVVFLQHAQCCNIEVAC